MSSPYPNLSPEGQRIFDPGEQMSDPQQGKADFTPYLQETYARPIGSGPDLVKLLKEGQSLMQEHADRIKALEIDCANLRAELSWSQHGNREKLLRIEDLESLLTECMRVMKLYINVPEFDDLQSRWEKLKEQ
jgi:hypothetical protein